LPRPMVNASEQLQVGEKGHGPGGGGNEGCVGENGVGNQGYTMRAPC
jgi:hypothetical protein